MHRRRQDHIHETLKKCILFHGHLCPGLVYGYRVAREAQKIMKIKRSRDEEIVVVCENDSCAVDAIQVLLGATAGKGNLMIKDYGKNAFTIISRTKREAYRFVRKTPYEYRRACLETFEKLDAKAAAGQATKSDWIKLKRLKSLDLLDRRFDDLFLISKIKYEEPPYAKLARSIACPQCGEMTMLTKMVASKNGLRVCIPCAERHKNK